jgi:heme-degrading monooxygenase HmoA
MFSVIFEVQPRPDQWDAYLGHAKMLRPELEQIEGFVDNIRYRSLTRDGWLLSLSNWRDEKALVRWRTQAGHHAVQEKGRGGVLFDYHMRIGQFTHDTRLPKGQTLREQRLDETDAGEGTALTLVDSRRPAGERDADAHEIAASLGHRADTAGLIRLDVFDAVLTPGDMILLTTWRDAAAAQGFEPAQALGQGARLRRVRVIRDYGMFDRREAPQYYPDVARG